jgi:lipooligosaccharide transport system ATP-binding protein
LKIGRVQILRNGWELSMQGSPIIEANDLIKDYGKLRAVDNICFKVVGGECYGFLGPNGAGKTTTMKMVQCVLPPTSGELYVAGMSVKKNAREIKAMIGVVPQENNLDLEFTVYKNLIVYSRYFDIPKDVAEKRASELLEFFSLIDKGSVIIDNLSTGMKRRLLIARALINDPDLLVLDEPTTGLDPQARHMIWDRIGALKKKGVTVLLTTHYMEEAAQLCDSIVIMDHGKIVEEGNPKDLVKKHVGENVLETPYSKETLAFLKETYPNLMEEVVGDKINVFTNEPERILSDILVKHSSREAIIRSANLEDVFLKLTGRRLRE